MSRRSLFSIGVAAMLLVTLLPGSVAATSLGTWSSTPAQTVTTNTSSTTSYQVQVQQPINADGTSSYKASRGVIPVKFSLASGTSTTTTTTTGPLVFQSLNAYPWPDPRSYGWVGDTFSSPIALSAITNLSASYTFTTGDCYAGSLRFALYTTASYGAPILVYPYNPNSPTSPLCTGANSQTGTNWTGIGANVEAGNLGNLTAQYDTWANVVAAYGTQSIYAVALIVDSGYVADEVVNLASVTVNSDTFTPKSGPTTSSTTPVFASTCSLPPATIQINKTGVTDALPVDETVAIQTSDTGGAFRISSCQYIYNLDVSALPGSGTYTVSVLISGTAATGTGTFGLK